MSIILCARGVPEKWWMWLKLIASERGKFTYRNGVEKAGLYFNLDFFGPFWCIIGFGISNQAFGFFWNCHSSTSRASILSSFHGLFVLCQVESSSVPKHDCLDLHSNVFLVRSLDQGFFIHHITYDVQPCAFLEVCVLDSLSDEVDI